MKKLTEINLTSASLLPDGTLGIAYDIVKSENVMPVNVNELRLDNLCRDALTGAILSVREITVNDEGKKLAGFYVVDRSKFPLPKGWKAEAISLTPDILGKCRLVRDGTVPNLYLTYYVFNELDFELSPKGLFLGYHGETNFIKQGKQIEFVHQLQNVIFDITGTELNVEL